MPFSHQGFINRLLVRRKGALAAGLDIAAYVLLVGADPRVVRADGQQMWVEVLRR